MFYLQYFPHNTIQSAELSYISKSPLGLCIMSFILSCNNWYIKTLLIMRILESFQSCQWRLPSRAFSTAIAALGRVANCSTWKVDCLALGWWFSVSDHETRLIERLKEFVPPCPLSSVTLRCFALHLPVCRAARTDFICHRETPQRNQNVKH